MPKPTLGVCYYPEHWPQNMWADDAARMRETGISVVRIGEFAWSRIEPARDRFEFDWLDAAIETLADAGLSIILGTPTATPPKWLVDEMPDMLAKDERGHDRGFGSRRHYDFAHWVTAANARASSKFWPSVTARTRRSRPGRRTTNMAATTPRSATVPHLATGSAIGWRRNTSRQTR